MTVHIICIQLICVVLVMSQYVDGRFEAAVTSTPKEPVVGSKVSIECKGITKPDSVASMLIGIQNGTIVDMITWDLSKNIVKRGNKYKKADELVVTRNVKIPSMTITFKVALEDGDLSFQCAILGKEVGVISQKFHKLKIRVPPKVESVGMVPKTVGGKSIFTVVPGETRQVKCTVMKGSAYSKGDGIKFTAPGNGSDKFEIVKMSGTRYKTVDYVLSRVFDASDNGRKSVCTATNDAGTSSQIFFLNVTYSTRNTMLSVSKNANISVGDEISCKSEGNPTPIVRITVSGYTTKDAHWASKGGFGVGSAFLFIPHNASLGRYTISCNATNYLQSEVVEEVAVNVIATSMTINPNQAASYASAGVIGGIILGLLILIVLVAIICFVVQRRQNETAKQESSRNEYQPVSTKPTEQQGGAELEKDIGPYDIDAHDYKSGGQGGSHPGDRSQQTTALFLPSSGGSNGEQQFVERRDAGVDDELDSKEQLNYISLDFDETPCPRMPIVFQDSDKVEYSEIVSSPNYNNSYDDEHYYENVRHHVV